MSKQGVQLVFVLCLILFAAACPPRGGCGGPHRKRSIPDQAGSPGVDGVPGQALSRGLPGRGKFSILQRAVP